MSKSSLPADDLPSEEQCAVYLKVLAEPRRIAIIKALRDGPLSVSQIAEHLGLDLTLASHHLRVLYHAGITTTERDGKYVYYSLNPAFDAGSQRSIRLDFGCCRIDLAHDSEADGSGVE